MERAIRKQKHYLLSLETAVDVCKDAETKQKIQSEYDSGAAELGRMNRRYHDFCEENGLRELQDRLHTARWERKNAKRAIEAANRILP